MSTSRLLKLVESVDRGERTLANALSWPDLDLIERVQLPHFVEYERRRLQWRRPSTRRAVRRSFRLLRSFLDESQRRQLRNTRSFRFQTASGKHYRIWLLWDANIEEVRPHGQRWYAYWSFCIHPPLTQDGLQPVPPADVALGQLLMLLDSEDRFLETANPTPRRPIKRMVARMVREGRLSVTEHPELAPVLERIG